MTEYSRYATQKADGFYVSFEMLIAPDSDAHPSEYLFQDEDYREEDQARLDAFNSGDWGFVGVQAKATCTLIRGGVATVYELTSPGVWSVEDDCPDHVRDCYLEEVNALKSDIDAMTSPIFAAA